MYSGNQTVRQLEARTGWVFTEEEYEWLESHRQDIASVRSDSGKFHIFDIPFCIYASPLIKDRLLEIAERRGNISDEPLQMIVVKESSEERREREARERHLAKEARRNDDSVRWMWKWGMEIPVNGKTYRCFFNTKCMGYYNHGEPAGTFRVYMDEEGFHGEFMLNGSDIIPASKYVIGLGFYENGRLTEYRENFEFTGRIEDYLRKDQTYAVEY